MRIELTVPSTRNTSEVIPANAFEHRINLVAHYFIGRFGGCTVTRGVGYYTDSEGAVVTEDVAIVTALTDNYQKVRASADVQRHAAEWCAEWSQECILVTTDNVPVFVEG